MKEKEGGERKSKMEEYLIIELLNERSEDALKELEKKYGSLCKTIGKRILSNEQDIMECLNDTFLAAWNQIPPNHPESLQAYVCRIMKNHALKKAEYNTADKRNSIHEIVIEELAGTIACPLNVEDEVLTKELVTAINQFLKQQKKLDRILFVRRYWFMDSVSDIADFCGKSNNYVTVHLYRIREKLRKYLKKEGLIE